MAQKGDDTPIGYMTPDDRYVEKLATPDVTIADLIGDVDPWANRVAIDAEGDLPTSPLSFDPAQTAFIGGRDDMAPADAGHLGRRVTQPDLLA